MSENDRRNACLEFAPALDKLADRHSHPQKMPRRHLRHGDRTLPSPPLLDRLRPRLHNRYWNWDRDKFGTGGHKSLAEIVAQLFPQNATGDADELRAAEFTLEQAKSLAAAAFSRAEVVERRATTIVGSVAISTSFTLTGSALVMDHAQLPRIEIRIFAALLAVVTIFFVLSAWYSLRALAGTRARTWNWESPWLLDEEIVRRPTLERIIYRSADLLDDFAYNWEKADLKKRCVDNAVMCLTIALWGIGILSVILAVAILSVTKIPTVHGC